MKVRIFVRDSHALFTDYFTDTYFVVCTTGQNRRSRCRQALGLGLARHVVLVGRDASLSAPAA